MKISFLIVNYYTADSIKRLVNSIEEFLSYDFEILIWDNSENISERKKLESLLNSKYKLFTNNSNIGFSKGNNRLYEQSNGDIIIAINPDTVLIDASINDAIEYFLNNNVGILGPKLLNEDKTYQISFFKYPNFFTVIKEHYFFSFHPYAYKKGEEVNLPFISEVIKGACMIISKELIEKIGFFDESFFLYSEEIDLCRRANTNGFKVIYYPQFIVVHSGRVSTSQKSLFSYYHYIRSKILYFNKYYNKRVASLLKKLIIFSLLYKSIIFKIIGKKQSASLFYKTYRKVKTDV